MSWSVEKFEKSVAESYFFLKLALKKNYSLRKEDRDANN